MQLVYIPPPTATGESIVNAIVAAGLPGTYPAAPGATAEAIVLALHAAGFVPGLVAATATPEAICLALIGAALMAAGPASTWRADLVEAHRVILEQQSTATPTLLRKVHTSQPGSFGELPLAFIGSRTETVTHDAGTRTRTIGLEVHLVDNYSGDNEQGGDRMDALVDALVDLYDDPANVQKVGSSIIELTSITDTDLEVRGNERSTFYRDTILTFGKAAKWEGRQ